MNKVKCTNGHFYDAEKFLNCPICGAEAAAMVNKEQNGSSNNGSTSEKVDGLKPTAPLFYKRDTGDGEANNKKVTPPIIDELPPTEPIYPEDIFPEKYITPDNKKAVPGFSNGEEEKPASPRQEPDHSSLKAAVDKTASKHISPLPKTTSYYDMDEAEPPVGWIVCVKGPYQGKAFECVAGNNRIGRNLDLEICLTEDPKISRLSHAILTFEPKQGQFYLQAGAVRELTYLNDNALFGREELKPYDKISIGNSEFVFLPICGERFTWDEYIVKE